MLNLKQQKIINDIALYVQGLFSDEGSGHDWWHIARVWNTSKKLAEILDADQYIVQLAALLHDIADWKFHDGDLSAGPNKAKELLTSMEVEDDVINHVCEIIENISFKGAGEENGIRTIEGMIVQDADRLDAIGAIGVARAFAYGGSRDRLLYDPDIDPEPHDDFEEYKSNTSPTINHFYEKLLLLKELMNTDEGKRIAEERHRYLEDFLNQFYREWDGKDIL
jgi:uncharacterized protein